MQRKKLSTTLVPVMLLLVSGCAVVEPQVHSVIVDNQVITEPGEDVRIERGGQTLPVGPGTVLEKGDRVITGANAQAVLLLENGKVEVLMMPGSEINYSSIFVRLGEVFVRVKEKVEGLFEVESEYVGAIPVTTEFLVAVDASGAYRCVALEGRLQIRATKNTWPVEMIATGQLVEVHSGVAPTRRLLTPREFNSLVRRINAVEQLYRRSAAELMVPNLVGMPEADAQTALRSIGLTTGRVVPVVTDRQPVGNVASSVPATGQRLRPGGVVQLNVEAEPTTVPRVVGQTTAEASRNLRRSRLQVGEQRPEITGKQAAGTIVRQDPAADSRVPVESKVTLWVEAESVRVPQLVRLSLDAAERALKNNRLALGEVGREAVVGASRDIVRSQSTPANSAVAPGTRVDLVVSEPGVRVPGVLGQSQAVAARRLRNDKLVLGQVSYREDSRKAGSVIEQIPPAGDVVAFGTPIDIVLVKTCTVPNVLQLTSARALEAMTRAGLRGTTYVRRYANGDLDRAYEQSRPAGTEVNCGTSVRIGLGTTVVQ